MAEPTKGGAPAAWLEAARALVAITPEPKRAALEASLAALWKAAASPSPAASLPAGPPLAELPPASFSRPRGKYALRVWGDCAALVGPKATFVLRLAGLQRVFLLPLPNGRETVVALQISAEHAPAHGKQRLEMVAFRVPVPQAKAEASGQPGDKRQRPASSSAPVVPSAVGGAVDALVAGSGAAVCRPEAAVFRGHSGGWSVACSLKAREGMLFPLRGGMFFLYASSPMFWAPERIASIGSTSRGMGSSTVRTFDLVLAEDTGGAKPVEHCFGMVQREEQEPIAQYAAFLQREREKKAAGKKQGGENHTDDETDDETDNEEGGEEEEEEEDDDDDDDDDEDDDFDPGSDASSVADDYSSIGEPSDGEGAEEEEEEDDEDDEDDDEDDDEQDNHAAKRQRTKDE